MCIRDRPYIVRLLNYLNQVFLHFDLGDSYFTNQSVMSGILYRMPYTITIAVICMLLQILIGTPLGITAATHQNGLADRFCMIVALLGVSIPGFWLAMMMVILFAAKLNWLPAYGVGGIQYYILPCIANAFAGIASQARQTRSSMLEVIRSDYVAVSYTHLDVYKRQKNTYIKIPVNREGIKAIKELKRNGFVITATAIYTREQAFLAGMAGADYAAVYYNRMQNLSIDSRQVTADIVSLYRMHGMETRVLAASFKNCGQVLEAVLAGAQSVTLPAAVLDSMVDNALIDKAVSDFKEDWTKINGEKRIDEVLTQY